MHLVYYMLIDGISMSEIDDIADTEFNKLLNKCS